MRQGRRSIVLLMAALGAMSLLLVGGVFLGSTPAKAAYHHMGEMDSPNFLAAYPDKAGTKVDSCSLCHSGGAMPMGGKDTSVGSCQWCHFKYGYDARGDIKATLNGYGSAYLAAGRTAEAIRAVEGRDSDEDGWSNAEEIAALRYPGDAKDDPTKVPAPYKVFDREDLEAMPQHSQIMVMNASKSTDFYAEYTGVSLEALMAELALGSATGITVYSPDGFSQYHPLAANPQVPYQVNGDYPQGTYYYSEQADVARDPKGGWTEYASPATRGLKSGDAIANSNGLKLLLAIKRDGQYIPTGVLNNQNKLDGEGPYRVTPPQMIPGPPDQRSTASNQKVIWPYDDNSDHNAGYATRAATIIRVEPLPEGTTDIDLLEAGWSYVDQNKIVIYGAINPLPAVMQKLDGMISDLESAADGDFRSGAEKTAMMDNLRMVKEMAVRSDYASAWQQVMEGVVGATTSGKGGSSGPIANRELQKKLYWTGREVATFLKVAGE